jgi:hypothetical protein
VRQLTELIRSRVARKRLERETSDGAPDPTNFRPAG